MGGMVGVNSQKPHLQPKPYNGCQRFFKLYCIFQIIEHPKSIVLGQWSILKIDINLLVETETGKFNVSFSSISDEKRAESAI